MGIKQEFIIPFSGLSLGEHTFNYTIEDSFFEGLDYSEVKKGKITANIILDKQTTMLVVNLKIKGVVNVECDRCGEYFDLPFKNEQQLIFKFGSEFSSEKEDDIIYIPASETEINLEHHLYEYIILALPTRRVHPDKNGKSGCDPEIIKKLNALANKAPENEKTDPRWDALRKIKNN